MLGGVAFLLPGSIRPVALLGALFLLLGYLLAWRNPELTGSVLGFGILGALLGAYVSVRPLLAERYPEAVFYAEWLALVVAVAVAVGIVWKRTERPEEYLEDLLAETPSLRIPPEERVERIVREFLLTGRKAELLSYVAFYGSRTFGNREEFKRAIELLSEYEPKRPGPLTPFWLRRRILRNELERRKKLIEELFSLLGVST
jgi:small basic protein